MATRRAQTAPRPSPAPFTSVEVILREQIAARAYERFLERGGEHGHDLEDWLEAEQEVLRNAAEVVTV